MSVADIFEQLHDPTTWPPVPDQPLRPYDVRDQRPLTIDELLALVPTTDDLRRWAVTENDLRASLPWVPRDENTKG